MNLQDNIRRILREETNLDNEQRFLNECKNLPLYFSRKRKKYYFYKKNNKQ